MSSLLGDFTSWLDSKKRIAGDNLSSLLDDPYATIQRLGTQGADQLAASADMFASGDYGQMGSSLLGNGMAGPLQTVWHGSPYLFSKFDASKIGTGEGAQAYGHGLYFAENRDVAKGYTRSVPMMEVNGKAIQVKHWSELPDTPEDYAAKAMWSFGDRATASDLLYRAEKYGGSSEFANSEVAAKARKLIDDGKVDFHSGSLLKVDLPDEHIAKMLDWDKPLSQRGFNAEDPTMTGAQLWNALSLGADRKKAAEMLRKQGIPGIKYLDAGSRKAGDGTRNYVVFPGNEDILKILERQ